MGIATSRPRCGRTLLEPFRSCKVLTTILLALGVASMSAQQGSAACALPVSVCTVSQHGSFPLVQSGHPADILLDPGADSAVQHVAISFATDLERVSGSAPRLLKDAGEAHGPLVVLGVLHQSALLDSLIRAGKIDPADIAGEWEAFRQIVVDHPFANVPRALVIVGSDRRGVVYGAYDLSEKMGVSPWYWFADVPVAHHASLYVTAGSRRDQPRVKYRGFFINDENPSFNAWALKHFGGINARMYEHVFELDLRLKGNFLWPAMWAPKAFAADDPENMILADSMGVVMGTSHHEAMMRAQDEWHRNTAQGVTGGKWDYTQNAANLRQFWRGGIERMVSKPGGQPYESLVTVGMRGDGDEPMAEGTATQLLETIVADQRKIIAEVTHKPASETPQVWALYKEVQDYYDHGMKVPDDVTLLFSDDNWGQLRRLPEPDTGRKGGYGIYYHFDYVGLPRNYKWINTTQIEKTWQQMDLAYASGARQLWIVNVGDIKPLEFPLSFFMKQAWDPQAMTLEALSRFPEEWARATFGPMHSDAIGRILTRYSQLAARRKPELVDAESFSLSPYPEGGKGGEFGALIADWDSLTADMHKVKATLPADENDAYFELVEHPVLAFANLYHLYYAVAWNHRLAAAKDPRANGFADEAEADFRRDQQITDEFHALRGGKWDGMMLQTHIGYTGWQQPERQVMPAVERVPKDSIPKPVGPSKSQPKIIAIEASNFSRAVNGKGLSWRTIPHLGSTLGAVTAFPQAEPATTPKDGVRLEYDLTLQEPGDLAVQLIMVPTLDTSGKGMLRIGLSVDDGPLQVLSDRLTPAPDAAKTRQQLDWNKAVEDNARTLEATLPGVRAGAHVLKVWRLDGNTVLQRIVVSTSAITRGLSPVLSTIQ